MRLRAVIAVVVFLSVILTLSTNLLFSHLVFDEGYNLQVPLLLHTRGNYATFDGMYDSRITTGWPVLLPAALLVHFSWWAPRTVILVYTLVLFWLLVRYVYTSVTQFMVFLIMFSLIPLSFLFSTHVLGELPAFVWMIAGYILLEKKRLQSAGICIGLAVVTKNSAIFALIPVVLLMVISIRSKHTSIGDSIRFVVSIFLPILFGEMLRFVSSGSVQGYTQSVTDYITFVHSQSHVHIDLIAHRIITLGEIVGFSSWLLILFIVFACIGVHRSGRYSAFLIALYSLLYGLFYLFLGPNTFYRTFFPILLGAVVCIPFWNKSRFGFFVITASLFLWSYGLIGQRKLYSNPSFLIENSLFIEYRLIPTFSKDKLLKDQLDLVHVMKDKTISGIGWHNAPELSYLLNKRIYRDYTNSSSCYIITGYIEPVEQEGVLRFISILYYKNTYYRIYKKIGC